MQDVEAKDMTDVGELAGQTVGGLHYTYAHTPVGEWSDSSNWIVDPGTPATTPPGENDQVQISGDEYDPSDRPFELTGGGQAASIDVSHSIIFDGSFKTGSLMVEAGSSSTPVNVFDNLSLDALSATVSGKLSVIGTESHFVVDNILQIGSDQAVASGSQEAILSTQYGGSIIAGRLGILGGTVSVDESGSIEVVGGAAAATGKAQPGALTVDHDATLTMCGGQINALVRNNGLIELESGHPSITEISGNGVVQADAGFDGEYNPVGTIDSDQTISFDGPDAFLSFAPQYSDFQPLSVDVSDFAPTDTIEVPGGFQIEGRQSSQTETLLTLTPDPSDLDESVFVFQGDYRDWTFSVEAHPDTPGTDSAHTAITVSTAVACFCPGTLITTAAGEVAVEMLAIGDLVQTVAGLIKPVLWIGRRSYHWRFAAGNTEIMPIRVRVGALGAGLPRRDLLLSPKHAILVDGVLVPVGVLVNGGSILQELPTADVHYLHVELDGHDLLLAEGAAAESFIDHNSRGMFHNAPEFALLYPDRLKFAPQSCAQRVEDGYQLEAIRHRIMALAGLTVNDKPISFRLHIEQASEGRLRGWAWCPAHLEAAVFLDVVVDDQVVCQVLADGFRRDLVVSGIGAGCHGFDLPVPELTSTSSIVLRRAA